MSFVYALEYMLFSVYPIVFQEKRGWNPGVGQLPFLGMVLGSVLSAGIIFAETAWIGKPRQLAGKPYKPEDRMRIGMIGAVLFAGSIYWISWSGEYNSVHWLVPTAAGVVLATSIGLLFFAIFNYLIDSYLVYAASAVAANTVCRSALAAAVPLFVPQMFHAMGVGGAGSLLGGCATLLAPIPFVFYKYGEGLRKRSKHARISFEMQQKAVRFAGEDERVDGRDTQEEDEEVKDEEMAHEYGAWEVQLWRHVLRGR